MFFAPTQRESDVKAMWRRTLDQCSTQSFKTLIETYRFGGGAQAALRNNNGRENHFHAWPPVFAAVFRIDSKQDPVEFALKARDKQAAGSVVGGCFYPLWWKGPRYRCFYVGTSISRVEKHLCSSGLQRLCKYLLKVSQQTRSYTCSKRGIFLFLHLLGYSPNVGLGDPDAACSALLSSIFRKCTNVLIFHY